MNMWRRKTGDYWFMREEFCYPGTVIFVHRRSNGYHGIILRNLKTETMTEIEVSREPKEAFSDYKWKTTKSAKNNAELIGFDRDWLHTAGITFNDEIMTATRRDALWLIHKYLLDKLIFL